jgi:hypothetical protein
LKAFKDCPLCVDTLLIDKDDVEELDKVPYLFTFYLTEGGLKFVSNKVFELAHMAMHFFKCKDSASQIISIQENASATGVAETLAKLFLATQVCKTYIDEHFPPCHGVEVAASFVKNLYASVGRRKVNLLNAALPKVTVHAGKTALMRTNPLVENRGKVFFCFWKAVKFTVTETNCLQAQALRNLQVERHHQKSSPR